jgi:hypothetical protein
MHILRPLSRAAMVALVTSALAACAVTPDDIDTGVSIPLTTTTPSGATYRLSNATFNFTGPEALSVPSGNEATLDVALTPGTYQLELAAGWRMERIDGGAVQPVDAVLVSQAVQQVAVLPGSLSQAYYQFLLSADGSNGSVSISFGVTEASTLTGTLDFVQVGCDPATNCAPPSTVVTQIAFAPLAAERATTDTRELVLRGSGAVMNVYGDAPGSLQQIAGSSIEMRLRGGTPGAVQELSVDIQAEVAGAAIHFAIGPTPVQVGIDSEGFPAEPTELTFEAPLLIDILPTAQQLQGTASLTYRKPATCTPDGTGCGTP